MRAVKELQHLDTNDYVIIWLISLLKFSLFDGQVDISLLYRDVLHYLSKAGSSSHQGSWLDDL